MDHLTNGTITVLSRNNFDWIEYIILIFLLFILCGIGIYIKIMCKKKSKIYISNDDSDDDSGEIKKNSVKHKQPKSIYMIKISQ